MSQTAQSIAMTHPINRSLIDTTAPACFIERADVVQGLARVMITQWLNAVNLDVPNQVRHYSQYIIAEVTTARDNPQLWNVIEKSRHIWLSSAFALSESAELFARVTHEAINKEIKDKIVFNWAQRAEAFYHLGSMAPECLVSIKYLERNRNIRFLFWEEIWDTMRANPPNREDPN